MDQAFKMKVWQWLINHPDVRVTGNTELLGFTQPNKSTEQTLILSTQQPHDTTVEDSIASNNSVPVSTGIVTSSSAEGHGTKRRMSDVDMLPTFQILKKAKPAPPVFNQVSDSSNNEPRVRVTEAMIWRALTGHDVDWMKVPVSEFQLLQIIGGYREAGISQPELTNLSGQDKRSLPKRTDALSAKGYIEKKPTYVAKSRTSHLTLMRMVKAQPSEYPSLQDAINNGGDSTWNSAWTGAAVDVKALMSATFEKLKDGKILTYVDLKRYLGINYMRWQSKVFSRMVRRLEKLGCVRRVRAESRYSRETKRKPHKCLKYIRYPVGKEWQLASDPNLLTTTEEAAESDEKEDDEDDKGVSAAGSSPTAVKLEEVRESRAIVPLWTPFRPLANQLRALIGTRGTAGISSMVRLHLLYVLLY
jgi:alkylated DNA nucleotide flippase Atl1